MMHHTGPAGESHRDHILFKEEAFCHGDGGGAERCSGPLLPALTCCLDKYTISPGGTGQLGWVGGWVHGLR